MAIVKVPPYFSSSDTFFWALTKVEKKTKKKYSSHFIAPRARRNAIPTDTG
jgi:hypothetical protein